MGTIGCSIIVPRTINCTTEKNLCTFLRRLIPMSPEEPINVITDALSAPKEADLGASKPVAQPKPTEREIRESRARHWTVRHATVIACGHKLEAGHLPSHANCEHCWFALFETTPEGVASVHDLLLKEGTQAVIAMHGAKFVKYFGNYLKKKLLQKFATPEVQAASGIEGGQLEVLDINAEKEASLGIQ